MPYTAGQWPMHPGLTLRVPKSAEPRGAPGVPPMQNVPTLWRPDWSINRCPPSSPRCDARDVSAMAASANCSASASDAPLAHSENSTLEHWVCAWAERMCRSIAEASSAQASGLEKSEKATPIVWPLSARGNSREPLHSHRGPVHEEPLLSHRSSQDADSASRRASLNLQALLPQNSRAGRNQRRRRNRAPGRARQSWSSAFEAEAAGERRFPQSRTADVISWRGDGQLSARGEPLSARGAPPPPNEPKVIAALNRLERAMQPLLQACAADGNRDSYGSRAHCWSTPGTTPGATPRMPDSSQTGLRTALSELSESQYASTSSPDLSTSASPEKPRAATLPQSGDEAAAQAETTSCAVGSSAAFATGGSSDRRPPVPLLSLGKLSLGREIMRRGDNGVSGVGGDAAPQAGASAADSLRSTIRPVAQEAAASTDGVPTPTVSEWRARPPPQRCWPSDGCPDGKPLPSGGRYLDLVSEEQKGMSMSSGGSSSSRSPSPRSPVVGYDTGQSCPEKAPVVVPPLQLSQALNPGREWAGGWQEELSRAFSPDQQDDRGREECEQPTSPEAALAQARASDRSCTSDSELPDDPGPSDGSARSMTNGAPEDRCSPEATARYCSDDTQACEETPWWVHHPRINQIVGLLDKVQHCIEQQHLVGQALEEMPEHCVPSASRQFQEDCSDSSTAPGDGDGDA